MQGGSDHLRTTPKRDAHAVVANDGIPQRRLSFGGPYMGGLPYDAVAAMELVKGPLSSLFGRNALAGVLHLFTDPGGPRPAFEATAYYEYPSHTARTAVRYAGPIVSGRPYTVSITGSFGLAEGWQPLNDSKRGDLYLHLRLPLGSRDVLSVIAGFFSVHENAVAPVFVDDVGRRLQGFSRDTNLSAPGQNGLDLTEVRAALTWQRDWVPWLRTTARVAYWHGDTYWRVARPSDQPASGTVASRPASDRELLWSKRFLESLADERGSSLDDLAVWADLCHMIFNRKEFIYLF